MNHPIATGKIEPIHLKRKAYLYIRHLTMCQVQANTARTQRQDILKQMITDLGWSADQVVMIDADQARSGLTISGLDRFNILLADVAARKVGAVCCLELSRMAMNSAGWLSLLILCRVTNTLLIDGNGIYSLRDKNDRLFFPIGIQWIADRLQEAKRYKAQTGELHLRLPTGLVYNRAGKIIHEPDQRVHDTVMLVFELYQQLGTAHAVVRKFEQNKMLFPKVIRSGDDKGDYEWGRLSLTRVLDMLRNPIYAGIYVFGRTKTKKDLEGEGFLEVRNHTIKLKHEEWTAYRPDSHEGYISQEQFLKNQEQLSNLR